MRGVSPTGPIAISAALIFTGRIAGIVTKLPAIRRQASPPHGRRDGIAIRSSPPGCRPYGPLLIPLASVKGPDLGNVSGLLEGNVALRRGARQLAVRSPRRIYRQGSDTEPFATGRPSLVITLALREQITARWPGASMNQRWLARNLLCSELRGSEQLRDSRFPMLRQVDAPLLIWFTEPETHGVLPTPAGLCWS